MENSNGSGLGRTNLVLSPQQQYFIGCGKQIQPTPDPYKCKQAQALPTLYHFLRMGIRDTRGGESR
jgi:hypothetical protein